MSSLIAALDNKSKLNSINQLGENGHLEYGWLDITNENMQEQLLQLYFQIVRCDISVRKDLINKFQQFIQRVYIEYKKNDETTKSTSLDVLTYAYKMIAYTRDIVNGKGEYRLGYSMLRAWYEAGIKLGSEAEIFFMVSAKQLLKTFLVSNKEDDHPYGSWKDVKYIAQDKYALISNDEKVTLKGFEHYATDGLICYGVDLLIEQLKEDVSKYNNQTKDDKSKNISLAARWVPREKSNKFGDLNKYIAQMYYNQYIKSAYNDETLKRAQRKAQTHFRQLVAKLNKHLNTVQINQCKNSWSNIEFEKHVTSLTMHKQKKAFLNSKSKDSEDRRKCSENFQIFINKAKSGKTKVKGKRVFVGDFVKDAKRLLNEMENKMEYNLYKNKYNNDTDTNTNNDMNIFEQEKLALDLAWKDNATDNVQLRNFIAMVDVSGSMESDNCFPMNTAIGLGLRIGEKSLLGNRVLTFSNQPEWVNLENNESFVDRVNVVSKAPWGMNTNFYAALKMILDAAVEAKMTADDVNNLTLVVLSNMQIDQADGNFLMVENKDRLHSITKAKQLDRNIDELFYQTGMSVCGEPWKTPHIVFWNLRSTKGFPSVSNKQNTTMVSGANHSLLNEFCEKGVEVMNELTPYKFMCDVLDNKRYSDLSSSFRPLLS